MSQAAVQLRVAGQTYRVVTSASPTDLERLAGKVEEALSSVTPPGRKASPQSLILAALALAHELEEERAARQALEARYHEMLTAVLERVDGLLGQSEPEGFSGEAEGEEELALSFSRGRPHRFERTT